MKPIREFTNRIICGDCVEVMKEMPSRSIDFVLTDPPYLVNYKDKDGKPAYPNDDNDNWLKPAFSEVFRVLKDNSFCVSFYGWSKVERFVEAWKEAGFYPVAHFVAPKKYASQQKFVRYYHEQAYLLAKGRPRQPETALSDVLEWHYTENRIHPTQKPLVSLMPLITTYSKIGDIVLDPFAGSGSIALAAKQLFRKYIGIELTHKYSSLAQERLRRSEP